LTSAKSVAGILPDALSLHPGHQASSSCNDRNASATVKNRARRNLLRNLFAA
jgi:hypothetical protein